MPCSRIQPNRGVITTHLDSADWDGSGTKMSPHSQSVFLLESQHHVVDPANSGSALDVASSTGCTSVGERLIMPSTSAVAV